MAGPHRACRQIASIHAAIGDGVHAPKQHDPEQPRLRRQPSSNSTTRSTAIVVDACLFGDFMWSGNELAIWDEEEASAMG
jgi:hypothetical protein